MAIETDIQTGPSVTLDASAVEKIAQEVREKLDVPGIILLVVKADSALAGISLIPGVNVANVAMGVRSLVDEMEKKYLAEQGK
jgi:hypothetical protein